MPHSKNEKNNSERPIVSAPL